jgi:hypothetical protein
VIDVHAGLAQVLHDLELRGFHWGNQPRLETPYDLAVVVGNKRKDIRAQSFKIFTDELDQPIGVRQAK